MSTKRILLIRHGQDEKGYRGGWSQRGLTEEGFAQVRLLATHLVQNWLPIDLIISSDLSRAVQTTTEISRVLQLLVLYDQHWREMNNGKLAGMPEPEALARYPGLFASSLEMDQPYPGGESPRQFFERIKQAFDRLTTEMVAGTLPDNIMVITHGGVINIIYYLLEKLAWTNKQPSFPTSPTSLHEVVYTVGEWHIKTRNNVDHLTQN